MGIALFALRFLSLGQSTNKPLLFTYHLCGSQSYKTVLLDFSCHYFTIASTPDRFLSQFSIDVDGADPM
jgi:hypothetical protein